MSSKVAFRFFFFLTLLALQQNRDVFFCRAYYRERSRDVFPNPEIDKEGCRTKSNRLCDPDGILINRERHRIVESILDIESAHKIQCNGDETQGIQIAVALNGKMDMSFHRRDSDEEEVARSYATFLHDKWGVGLQCSSSSGRKSGSTGLLFFLSIHDRAMYLSRGKALERILTNHRLDRILDKAKPHLREENYEQGVLAVLKELDYYLSRGELDAAERREEWMSTLVAVALFGGVFGAVALQARLERQRAREYARVESQLTELDRGRAEALQGQYQCRSCPICFEDFPPPVSSEGRYTMGSDGQPLKLLRCGHVFDQTCWSEWISSGQGDVRFCPICKQDVAGTGTGAAANETVVDPQQRRVVAGGGQVQRQRHDQDRMMRQYQRERNFRLQRMLMRYPRYVREDQVQRWTGTRYDGSLARDPSFTRHNPRNQRHGSSSRGRSSGSSSFGGGFSGGGRGARW